MNNQFRFLAFALLIFIGCKQKTESTKSVDISSVKINTELVAELSKMIELDQYVSGMPQGKYDGNWQGWFKYRDTISKRHKVRLEEILVEFGYPGYDLVGEEVSHDYWNMVQHCDFDPEFQQKVLVKLKEEVGENNARSSDVGFLTDRINANLGKPQIYGTQLDYNMSKCTTYPRGGLVDSINVDQRRQKLKMKPYASYLNEMLKMHFKANKEHYLKIGILEAKYH